MRNKLYVARDKEGELYLYAEEPNKYGDSWDTQNGLYCQIKNFSVFSNVKFEDDEAFVIYI